MASTYVRFLEVFPSHEPYSQVVEDERGLGSGSWAVSRSIRNKGLSMNWRVKWWGPDLSGLRAATGPGPLGFRRGT